MSLPQSTVGRNSVPFAQNLPDREKLWQQTYLEAFHKNYDSVQRWTRWKEDHEQVKEALESLPKKLSHEVLIPFGSKALMKAKLVHTNEILTSIGSTYFVKQTALQGIAMCDRRLKQSEEMLTKLEDERTLLSNRQTLPKIQEAFGGDDTKEIFEEYNEEAEAEWRREHRAREAEYRSKLAELRKNQVDQPPLQTEEDLLRRLDELELEEELNDELERLHADYEADYEDYENENSEDEETEDSEDENPLKSSFKNSTVNENTTAVGENIPSTNPLDCEKESYGSMLASDSSKSSDVHIAPTFREAWGEDMSFDFESLNKTRRISFADETCSPPNSAKNHAQEKDGNIYIRFHHSKVLNDQFSSDKPEDLTSQNQEGKPKYCTPADIYNVYKAQCSPQPKSILKKSSSYPKKFEGTHQSQPIQTSVPFGSSLGITFQDSEEDSNNAGVPVRDLSHLPQVLGDVHESTASATQSSAQETSQRPVSHFKKARQKKK